MAKIENRKKNTSMNVVNCWLRTRMREKVLRKAIVCGLIGLFGAEVRKKSMENNFKEYEMIAYNYNGKCLFSR